MHKRAILRSLFRAASSTILLSLGFRSAQAQTVDQSNYNGQLYQTLADYWNGQTFTPSAATSSGAGFKIWNLGGTTFNSVLEVELWGENPEIATWRSTYITGGTTSLSLVADQQAMIDVFWSAVGVIPGHEYFLAFHVSGGSNLVRPLYSDGEQYAAGYMYNSPSTVNHTFGYARCPSCGNDYAFEEFTDSSPTPEPSTIVLMGTGILGVFYLQRRRRRRWS